MIINYSHAETLPGRLSQILKLEAWFHLAKQNNEISASIIYLRISAH